MTTSLSELLMAFEAGYRAGEKGQQNMQTATAAFVDLLYPPNTWRVRYRYRHSEGIYGPDRYTKAFRNSANAWVEHDRITAGRPHSAYLQRLQPDGTYADSNQVRS